MMEDVPVGRSREPGGMMRVFLTGATGYIGSAVLDALVRAGHEVTCLVRNREKAALAGQLGGHPVVGDLSRPARTGTSTQPKRPFHAAARWIGSPLRH